ncbi:DNA mismatch repair protein Mlh3 isoform X2 [Salvelinus sp. IW2-2015]|uniref:DNA mismatch repair protein Mlh3 isoform X2 n=1 Tax=Salvelinus sp. IW2-2015 TaxID=2691554 RepID=UPI000CDFA137|nr:DNA mismatch repair protein Mlh3 isoform X2 [Salvelinus alpinus]
MIKCLSKEVQGKLRSGIAIFSLQQCLEELILNSIDASATCVGVRVDIEAFKVQVIDNGSGMDIEDMESVGNRYFTSKCSSLEDLDHLKFYGFRGEAVASIANLAMLVEISSRTKMSVKTHVKVFKDGKGLDVFEAETTRPSAGTTVVICNFFHNMPVRRNRMDSVLEFERIRQRVEAISLIHPSVSFTLKNDCTGTMVVQLSKARNTYYRFVQIHGLGRAQKLGEINHSHAQFEVSGYVGREGHYNNTLQFLYVNDRLLLKTRIHKLLNLLLRKVGSLSRQNDSPGSPPAIRSPKQRRGAELHAMYVINIMCHYSEYDICLEPAKTLIEFKDWESILFCIEEAVKAFLTRENLVSEISPEDIQDYICKNVFSGQTASTDGVKDSIGKGVQTHMEGVTLKCNVGRTLASEPVHRRQTEDSDKMKSVCQTCDGVESEQGDRVGKPRDKEVLTGFEQEQEHNTTNPQCRPSSVDTDQGLQYDSITDSSVTDSSESYKEVTKENESNAHLKSAISCPESSQHSLIFKTKGENLKMSIEEGTEMKDNKREHVSLSRCTVRAPCSLTQGIQSEMGSIKQTLPQPQDTELNPGGHRKIFLSHPYIHSSLPSQKCLSHQSRPGLALESREKLATKRKWPMVEGPGHLHVYDREGKDLPTGIPSKISTFMSCQKLALYKEAGSLDRFRRIYGKLTESNPVPVDVNSNYLAIDATASQTEHLVMNAKAVLPYLEADQERDVTESRLDLMKDHKSPLTLSMFTKLKSLSARSSEISLAAKLSQLKHQRTEVATSAFVHPPETTSNEDICPQDTVENNAILEINNGEHNNTGQNRDFIPGCSTNPLPDEKEANNVTASCDWLHHYDDAVGKLVYINKVTGLSKYEAPSAEETQVSCTSDVTNMAISVISKKDDIQDSNSLSSLYSEWTNPVFARPPMVGVDISSVQAEGLAVKIHNILFPYRFSKDMIHSMKVIHQVDKKFLACLINTQDQEPAACSETDGNLLVLVDQHAAHERVRLENLVADSYEDDPEAPGERRLCSSTVAPPLEVSVTEEELRLLRSCRPSLRGLGLEMQFSQIGDPQVLVGKVPMCFTEKERNELRRGRRSIIKPIVEEYLQEQIELLRSTGRVRGTLPLTVLKVLASLACHGAIKFNDRLSKEECCSLVGALSSCQLPFQCAHGRPSIAPLVDVLHLNDQEEPPRPNLRKLRRMYKAWELYGNR